MIQSTSRFAHPLPSAQNPRLPVGKQPLMTRFGSNAGQTQASVPPQVSRLLKHFDFTDIGNSHVKQIQLVYAACILWRLAAANERRKASPTQSYNEIRESLLRDSVGYAFWFFGTPTLQRLYLGCIPDRYKDSLIQKTPTEKTANGFWQKTKTTLKKWNPITGYAIPSSEQVKDLRTQALQALHKQDIKTSSETYKQVEHFYNKLVMHRNMATGVGLVSTILLLGIGINFLNFYLTNRNVERRNKELQEPPFPPAPSLPRFQPPAAVVPQLNTAPPLQPWPLPPQTLAFKGFQ